MSAGEVRLVEEMSAKEFSEALERSRCALLPVGSTEPHGYHLPMGTDSLIVTQIARRVAQRTGCLVAPTLPFGFSIGARPGVIGATPFVLAGMVKELGQSLLGAGLRGLVIVCGHLTKEQHTVMRSAADVLARSRPRARVALVPLQRLSNTWRVGTEDLDYHAGTIETSLVLALAPQLVSGERPVDFEEARKMAHPDQWEKRLPTGVRSWFVIPAREPDQRFRIGVLGDPTQARADLGERILEECVQGLCDLVVALEEAVREPASRA